MLTPVSFLHDNARPHSARRTTALLESLQGDVFNPPPTARSGAKRYHSSMRMKEHGSGPSGLMTTKELKDAYRWLKAQAGDLMGKDSKLVKEYDKVPQLVMETMSKNSAKM
ncbi:hypothetical protein HNY73_016105 [Argiope bruennichi]|uniref:Histone-lysine N-methyltransferase SETMAR n=1 Tax=Argiope bruennichi TaxID=94029 RepID=A0A8T0EIU1_ARGBR|nr:hypothetical protein HNY73_016105 [Argiope bruennichi]